MIRIALVCALALSAAGCKSHRSRSIQNVEPKNPQTLGELAVPEDFDFALTRRVKVQVELTAGNSAVAVVQEPGRFGYDPFSAITKGVVSTGSRFDRVIRVDVHANAIPVLIYRDGAFEETAAAIDLDGIARAVFP